MLKKFNWLAKIKKWFFIITTIYFSLYLLCLVLMISLGAGNAIINYGMLFSTLIYFAIFLYSALMVKDRPAKKKLKRTGKLFYKYSKYFLSLLNILFLIMALVNLNLGGAHFLKLLNILIAVLWLAFKIAADTALFVLKRKIKDKITQFNLLGKN